MERPAELQDLLAHAAWLRRLASYLARGIGDASGPSQMSLIQTSATCFGSDPVNTLEAIEVGYQKLRELYLDSNIHILTFFRTAGLATGPLIGGYNENVAGFKPFAQRTAAPGAILAEASVIDGDMRECQFTTQLFNNDWWVFACGS
jgi:hypothetical protein